MNSLPLQENLKKYAAVSECPVRNVISRFSGKWCILILCILSENDNIRFGNILKALPDISPKVLAETLKNLEADGFVNRRSYAEIPPRVEYSLSELGTSLMPVIWAMIEWAEQNFDKVAKRR